MALKYVYGVCTNTDDGEGNMCPLCKSKEKQRLLETDDFECRQCHEPLTKVEAPRSVWDKIKWPVIIGGGIAVIAAILAIIFLCKGTEPTVNSITLNHETMTLKVGETDKLEAEDLPDGAVVEFKASKGGEVSVDEKGVVTAIKEGTGKVRVTLEGNKKVKAICVYTVEKGDGKENPNPEGNTTLKLSLNKSQLSLKVGNKESLLLTISNESNPNEPVASSVKESCSWTSSNTSVATVDNKGNVVAVDKGATTISVTLNGANANPATCNVVVSKEPKSSGINLGYGIYKGDTKNGQPHGHGIITYTRQHKIVSSKDFIAYPGDRFEGDFREGRIESIGYWYHDGQQTAIKP